MLLFDVNVNFFNFWCLDILVYFGLIINRSRCVKFWIVGDILFLIIYFLRINWWVMFSFIISYNFCLIVIPMFIPICMIVKFRVYMKVFKNYVKIFVSQFLFFWEEPFLLLNKSFSSILGKCNFLNNDYFFYIYIYYYWNPPTNIQGKKLFYIFKELFFKMVHFFHNLYLIIIKENLLSCLFLSFTLKIIYIHIVLLEFYILQYFFIDNFCRSWKNFNKANVLSQILFIVSLIMPIY